MSNFYLEIQNLSAGYHQDPIIQDVSLNLEKGKILAVIGPNGAGKSTFLKTIMHQIEPMKGVLFLDRQNLNLLKERERARILASVRPGKMDTEYYTVWETVSMGRFPYTGVLGLLSEEDRQVIYQTMQQMKIEDLADKNINELSDGQIQRVILGRALCQQPDLLILDEPTSFLDIRYQLEFLGCLRQMVKSRKLTVLLSIHELEMAERIADYVICMKEGRIVRQGLPEDIFQKEIIDDLFDITEDVWRSLQ